MAVGERNTRVIREKKALKCRFSGLNYGIEFAPSGAVDQAVDVVFFGSGAQAFQNGLRPSQWP